MPFSRYQIRNEFSLADPELYKSADKDDPEALLEGVAMAGLVGVLRQLGDLAEFAAEIFHGLHEEVMVTAARGHGLLGRVQDLESDLPIIERAFLSQSSHSPFFSSSGIGWHPNLKTEQNLITRGDLPRFVMDSYEECRGPPRLFLLDKFDVAGAGACLKRYTDPSFYKVEASSYEMTTVEAQSNKKIRKTKKKGSQWKNGETPEVFHPSHVKLHQLLLEERIQTGASEPTHHVKLKKRQIKLPFDTENGKGYMEKLLSSPPKDKLVHEVPMGSSHLSLPTISFDGPALETREVNIIDSSLPRENESSYDSPSVDKTVTKEHMNNVLETSKIELEEDIEEKHVYIDDDCKADGYKSDDAASEAENYLDALATMESEIETDVELRASSDQFRKQEMDSDANIEELRSHFSDSQSAADDESSKSRKKLTSFSYSDTASISVDNMSPRGIDSPQAFACTEIPFRPRVSSKQGSVSSIDAALPVDEAAVLKENTSKESESSEMSSNHCENVNSPKETEEIKIVPEEIIDCTSDLADIHSSKIDDQSSSSYTGISDSTPVTSHVENLHICDPDVNPDTCSLRQAQLTDEDLESKSDPAEAAILDSTEDEMKLTDGQTASVDLEHLESNSDHADDRNRDGNIPILEEEKEAEFIDSETETMAAAVSVSDHVDSNGSEALSVYEDTKFEGREVESVDLESEGLTVAVPDPSAVEKNEDNNLSILEEPGENGLVNYQLEIGQSSNESVESVSVISPEVDKIPAYSDPANIHEENLDSVDNDVDNPSANNISPDYDHSKVHNLDSIPSTLDTYGDENDNETEKPPANLEILPEENLVIDQNGLQNDVSPHLDYQVINGVLDDQPNAQFLDSAPNGVESISQNQVDHIDKLEPALSIEEIADQPHIQSFHSETVDSRNSMDTHSEGSTKNQESFSLEQVEEFEHPGELMPELPQLSGHKHVTEVEYLSAPGFSGFNMLPQVAPINLEEMPPLPPLPPMQWRMGKLQDASLISRPGDGQHIVNHIPPAFPQVASHPSLDQKENAENEKSENDHQDMEDSGHALPKETSLHIEEDGDLVISSGKNGVKFTEPPVYQEQSESVSTSGREIIRPSSTSSLPPVVDQVPNGIRPMKIQRPRTPLIDAVAAHDKSKLRKVSERPMPPIPKEEERDTLLEQIRAKSFNLKPAVQTRPSIQGPSTNLRVAAILEKANAIRHAFAGSDEDEDDDDSWSDS